MTVYQLASNCYLYFNSLPGTDSHYPPTIPHTEIDQHAHSPQLVELCKRFELSNDAIDKEVSDEHILEIYPQLKNWRRVAAHLGLTQADSQAIEGVAKSDEVLMRLYMLQEWKRKKILDGTVTYQVLLKALIKCSCPESAIQVCELLTHVQKITTHHSTTLLH